MTWAIVVGTLAVVVAIALMAAAVVSAIRELTFQVSWLRKELKAGLGVESSDKDGWASGGFLREVAEEVRKSGERQRSERRERDRF